MRGMKTISKFEIGIIVVKQGLEVEVEHIWNGILRCLRPHPCQILRCGLDPPWRERIKSSSKFGSIGPGPGTSHGYGTFPIRIRVDGDSRATEVDD